MRQVQRPAGRTSKPAARLGPVHPAVHSAVRGWLARLDPAADPWPRPTIPIQREGR